jgi:hypothetical protein
VCSRLLTTTVMAAVDGAIWIQVLPVTLRWKIKRRLSLKCWFLGHEDWIRRAPGRVYLECVECGRETHGWTTDRNHRADRTASGGAQAASMCNVMTCACANERGAEPTRTR